MYFVIITIIKYALYSTMTRCEVPKEKQKMNWVFNAIFKTFFLFYYLKGSCERKEKTAFDL